MSFKKIIPYFVFVGFLFNCKQDQTQTSKIQIIPVPDLQTTSKGKFVLKSSTGITYHETFKVSAEFLKSFIEMGSQIKLQENKAISFVKDSSIVDPEGYKLDISRDGIEIKATTDQGAFYAVQSLRQLLPVEFENGSFANNEVAIPCVSIDDKPQFKYRGMHLDVGRHMFPVEFIKKYIDAIAMLKMNTFHWHLTEDQGWRIEIKKYPKLQEIAAFRNETIIGHNRDQPQQFDGQRYGGYYTQEEIKDIVAYAQKRFVTIIPEIEMPGHSQAAISAYPELGCTGNQIEVATKWGVFEDIYCTKDETFEFLEGVLDEVLELFPSTYIHIGGGEAPKTRWKACKVCQQRIQDEGLKDEHELQSYFITRMEEYLNSKGRQIIGWDEILEGGLAPNATVMSWRGIDGAIEAAKQHHTVILTPGSHCYFDHYQSENEDEPLAIGGFLPLEKVYSFNPIPEELTAEEAQYVLGAQGNVWTEYMADSKYVEYMVFPRILAMSELDWSLPENKNFEDFVSRVENFHQRLKTLDINYADHLYELKGELKSENDQVSYQLKTFSSNKDIRYTLDDSEPTIDSQIYDGPIKISASTTIKAAVFDDKEKLGETFVQNINIHKAFGKQISMNVEPSKSYPGKGKEGLVNGLSGSNQRFNDKEWLGFAGDDLEIIIDLGEATDINTIETRFFNTNGDWVYAPKDVSISFETSSGIHTDMIRIEDRENSIVNLQAEFENLASQKITLTIQNYGIIPEGSPGAGSKAWTFIDEIVVN